MPNSVLIVGEAWGEEEERERRPFVGASGRFLRDLLRQTGIASCDFTNCFNLRPRPTNDISNLCGPARDGIKGLPPVAAHKYIRAEFLPELQRLYKEINSIDPNLIITVGGTALVCTTWQHLSISKNRGTLFESKFPGQKRTFKILPTYHPAAVLREWSLRPVVFADLIKAARHASSPILARPSRKIWTAPSLADLRAFSDLYMQDPDLLCGVDIETLAGTITEIGFAPSPYHAIVVPFFRRSPPGNYWGSARSERAAWDWVAKQLSRLRRPVFQNGLYDINYLWRTVGIQVRHAGEDTMLLAHSLQPEMKKSLGFLGSIYTDEPAWKLMRQTTLKKEDE